MKRNKNILLLLLFLIFWITANAQTYLKTDESYGIEYIDFIHCSHTDYGYTDHPYIVEDLQHRFLDIAIDAASETSHLPEGQRFCWTAEAIDVVGMWWEKASPERRKELVRLIENGQIEINGLPFNFHPFLNARQWDLALHWVSGELWEKFQPEIGIQHDVNGFSQAAGIRLLDRGIKYIWNGINYDWGDSPFPQPYAFWWEMPDGRKLLVWQSFPYWYGYNLLTERDWRYVQSNASDTQFRTPRIGDILPSDEESVRKAHAICLGKIKKMREEGYNYDFIAVSITNQWRIDNDGPFPPLADFINKWNELELKPKLRLTTVANAMSRIENRIGNKLRIYKGEWPDWWVFGAAANPRELAVSRLAGNYVEAALSPVWGGNGTDILAKTEEIGHKLLRYYEHTFLTNEATSNPYSFFNLGNLAEKSIYAYRPYEQARWLLAQRMRTRFTNEQEGLYVVNTGGADYSGWIELDRISFRDVDYKSVKEPVSKGLKKLYSKGRIAKFWVDNLNADSFKRFILSEDPVTVEKSFPKPEIRVDSSGWPESVYWKGMEKPLFAGDIGKFLSLESAIGRDIQDAVWYEEDSQIRMKKVAESTTLRYSSVNEVSSVMETPFSIIYKQKFYHPRLKDGERKIEIWKNESRISLDVSFYRLSSENPEIFYVEFPLPETGAFPMVSNGGQEFQPYLGQLPGTCTDFFTIDGWVNYVMPSGSWLWSSRDASLISFSAPQFAAKRLTPPENMNKIMAMVYNNMWQVNFLNDCSGDMHFHFDLIWKDQEITPGEADQITRTYNLPPVVMLNPVTREDRFTFKRMNEVK